MGHAIPHPKNKWWHNAIRLTWMLVFGAGVFALVDHIAHYDIVAHICIFDHGIFGYVTTALGLIFAALYFGFEKGESPAWWRRLWRRKG